MAIKVRLRRFVALLLCCVLVGSSFSVQAYATDPVTAASLAITGGQLAGAGLSGEAALSLAGPVGAVVGVTLGALGLNAYVTKAAQEAGKTRTRFVLDKLVIWGAQAGYTQEQLYSKIAEGISVAADGTIQLSKDAAQMISQFGSWAFTQDGTVVPSINTGETNLTVSVGDYNLIAFPGSSDFQYNAISGVSNNKQFNTMGVKCIVTTGVALCSNGIVVVANASELPAGKTNLSYLLKLDDVQVLAAGFNINSRNPYGYSVGPISTTPLDITVSDFISLLSSSGAQFGSQQVSADEVFTGTPDSWAENKDLLNPSAEDTPVILNPDLLNPIIDSLADGQQATMSIIDYLQALQDTWDHALDDVQTAIGTITDSLTGIQEQIAVPQTAVENPTVTNPGLTPDTTPILDPSTVDPGTAVTGLSFDLTQIFPFCIPFDIYAMLATLSATPEAPVYHVHYAGPYNIVIDFTVDLSPWNSVAAVLRTVELLAFCIGLAYVTRSMFIRS